MKKILMLIAIVDLVLIAFIACLAIKASAEYITAPSGLRLRKAPVDGEVIEVLPFKSEVTVLDDPFPEWMLIETKDGKQGVVSAEWLSPDDPASEWVYMGRWKLTAYVATGNPCASGVYPQAGVTLAQNDLPFGSVVFIQGVGTRTIQDRGPGYLGNSWADIFMSSYSEAVSWGMQKRDVWLISQP